MRATEHRTQPDKRKQHGRLRILLILIFLLAAACAALTAYSYKSAKDSLSLNFTDTDPAVEFGGEYRASAFIADAVGEVSSQAKFLDTDTLGEKELTYTVTAPVLGGLLNPEKDFTLSYTVTDTVPPLKIWSGSGSVVQRGTEFNISDYIAYGDNADPQPKLKAEGEVDINTNGTYPLHITVTDASGNSVDWDMTIEVADSVPAYTDDAERIQFTDFRSKNAGSGRSFGIDVSSWQDDVDFEAAAAAGCEFVMIRIGYSSGGEVTVDSKFDQNWERARAAGLKTGLYLYSYDNNEEDVRASADWIIEKLSGEKPDLPVVFDWEDFGRFQTYKMSLTDLNRLYDVFADELAAGGYDCMLYGSKNYLEKIWTDTDIRPVWLAQYAEKPDYKGPYRIWQACSTGRIAGISGDVDLDIMYE
ncbi:MAG: DUF5011 domain-containing protein [Mogibacterium sp.]|nr:DUF5011 domain-containing protein [Mogibacterium sp.]